MIAGLGNPGAKYADTKHNIGFITIDELAHRHNFELNKTKFEAHYAEEFIDGEKVLFVKPMTYMNNSGRAIRALMDYFDVSEKELLVIYDDLDLPIGKIRLRKKGGSGGHNGIKSIIDHLGTKEFLRIKVGIGSPYPKQSVVQHVLGRFAKEDHEDMLAAVNHASDATEYWLDDKTFEDTMSHFN